MLGGVVQVFGREPGFPGTQGATSGALGRSSLLARQEIESLWGRHLQSYELRLYSHLLLFAREHATAITFTVQTTKVYNNKANTIIEHHQDNFYQYLI